MRACLVLGVVLVVGLLWGALGYGAEPSLEVISVQNAERMKLLQTLTIPDYAAGSTSQCSIAFSSDGRLLVAASGSDRVPVWDIQTASVERLLYDAPLHIVACAFSPDGRWLACGGFDNAITLWDLTSGEKSVIAGAHSGPVWDLAFSSDSAKLVSCSLTADVRLWDVVSRALLWSYRGQSAYLSVAFAPSGTTVACGGRWDGVGILDATSGKLLAKPNGPYAAVGDVAFNAAGTSLAAGADDRSIYLWDAVTYAQVGVLKGHTGYVNGVTFNPDGTLLASGSHDKTVGYGMCPARRCSRRLSGTRLRCCASRGALTVGFLPPRAGTARFACGVCPRSSSRTYRLTRPADARRWRGTGVRIWERRSSGSELSRAAAIAAA